jgi:hypothetical protein
MNFPVAFLWIQNPRSIRLAKAQEKLEESILSFGLDPLRIDAGRDLVKLGVALARAREICGGTGFVWCNSDVILTKSPYDLPESSKTYGFHRREIPSGEINLGVDMFYIPNQVWDAILSKNFPPLLIGASYVDRWIPRYLEKVDRYENLKGYIDHPTHPTSSAAGADADLDYQHNFRVYRQWAKRYDLDPIDAPPYLVPGIGHVWGVRDGMSRLMKKIIHGSRGA